MQFQTSFPKNSAYDKEAELSLQLDNKNLSISTTKGTEGQKKITDITLSTKKEKAAKHHTESNARLAAVAGAAATLVL